MIVCFAVVLWRKKSQGAFGFSRRRSATSSLQPQRNNRQFDIIAEAEEKLLSMEADMDIPIMGMGRGSDSGSSCTPRSTTNN